jgi:hypothetical protein
VLLQTSTVVGTKVLGDPGKIFANIVEDTGKALLVLRAAIQLRHHLLGIFNGCERLIWAGVTHTGPGIGAVWDSHAEFQRAEARAGFLAALEKVLQFLVDRDAAGPPCRSVRATLNVTREKFRSGQQTTHSAHVPVAVATNLVVDTAEHKHLLLERLKRLGDPFQVEVGTVLVRPEFPRDGAVG